MRVCLLSTYLPQRCGIATYSAALAQGLAQSGEPPPDIISERGALSGSDGRVRSWPTFERSGEYGPSVLRQVAELGARLVHVQHSPDIFGMDARLLNLLEGLRREGVATAVTLHTVHSLASAAIERRFGVANFHRRLAETADALVVHGGPAMASELQRQGVPSNRIHEIPHGTPHLPAVDRATAREQLGVAPSAQMLLCFGFIHMQKNLHTVLLAMKALHRSVPNVLLYVAGSLQNRAWYNRAYLTSLRMLRDRFELTPWVTLREEFVAPDAAAALYAAADVVLLPYAQGYGSASGIAHQAIGAHRIPLCSRSPKFQEIGDAIDPELLVSTHSPTAWAQSLARLLNDVDRRQSLTKKVVAYAERTSWQNVARLHRELYGRLLSPS